MVRKTNKPKTIGGGVILLVRQYPEHILDTFTHNTPLSLLGVFSGHAQSSCTTHSSGPSFRLLTLSLNEVGGASCLQSRRGLMLDDVKSNA